MITIENTEKEFLQSNSLSAEKISFLIEEAKRWKQLYELAYEICSAREGERNSIEEEQK